MDEAYSLRKRIRLTKLEDNDRPQIAQYTKGDELNEPTWFVEQVVECEEYVELICRWEECPWDEFDYLVADIVGVSCVEGCYVLLEFRETE